jgi:hypothetical protein
MQPKVSMKDHVVQTLKVRLDAIERAIADFLFSNSTLQLVGKQPVILLWLHEYWTQIEHNLNRFADEHDQVNEELRRQYEEFGSTSEQLATA